MTAYGYLRCSTVEQAVAGYSIESQRRAIADRYPDAQWVEDAGASGSTLDRPGLAGLLRVIGRGDTLVVSKLDRLSRSVVDFGALLALAKDSGWALAALDFGMDTSTPNGELVANVLMPSASGIGARSRSARETACAQRRLAAAG